MTYSLRPLNARRELDALDRRIYELERKLRTKPTDLKAPEELKPNLSNTVVTETSFGQSPNAGSKINISRGDHTHGTPANPIPGHEAGADPHPTYVQTVTASTPTTSTGGRNPVIGMPVATTTAGGYMPPADRQTINDATPSPTPSTLAKRDTGGTIEVSVGTVAANPVRRDDSRLTDSRPPSGTAGGVLSGSFPNPGLAEDRVRKAGDTMNGNLGVGGWTLRNDGVFYPNTDGVGDIGGSGNRARIVYTQNVDSSSTIKRAGVDVVTTDDPRLTDSRPPSGAATGDLTGNYPSPGVTTAIPRKASNETISGSWTFTGKPYFDAADGIRVRNNAAPRYRSDYNVLGSGGLNINMYDDTGGTYLPITLDSNGLSVIARPYNGEALSVVGSTGEVRSSVAPTTSTGVVRKTELDTKANDADVVKLTGSQTITGPKRFSPTSGVPGIGGGVVFEPPAANDIAVNIRGLSGQTNSLTQWQDPAGTTLASVSAAGIVNATAFQNVRTDIGGVAGSLIIAGAANSVALNIRGFTGQTADLQRWENNAGSVLARVLSDGSLWAIGGATNEVAFLAQAGSAVSRAIIARGAASQSGDLQQWQNNAGSVVAAIFNDGRTYINPGLLANFNQAFIDSSLLVAPKNTTGNAIVIRGLASQSSDLQQWQNNSGNILASVPASGTPAAATDLVRKQELDTKVSSVTGTAPIVSSGGTTPAMSITAATTSAPGSMSAADKSKLDGIASGAQPGTVTSVTGTAPVTSTGGTTPVIGMPAADGTNAGYVSAVAQTIGGVKTFSSIPVLPASDPTTGDQATRKTYVDNRSGVTSVNGRTGAVTGLAEASHGVHGVSDVNGRTGSVTGLAEDNAVIKTSGNQTKTGKIILQSPAGNQMSIAGQNAIPSGIGYGIMFYDETSNRTLMATCSSSAFLDIGHALQQTSSPASGKRLSLGVAGTGASDQHQMIFRWAGSGSGPALIFTRENASSRDLVLNSGWASSDDDVQVELRSGTTPDVFMTCRLVQDSLAVGTNSMIATSINGTLSVSQQLTASAHLAANSTLTVASTFTHNGSLATFANTVRVGALENNSGQAPRLRSTDDTNNVIWFNWATGGTFRCMVDSSNVKNFIIPHPSNRDRYLIHTTLEGPENAVFYRGESKLVNGIAWIELPAYFEDLTHVEGRTVQLQPILNEPNRRKHRDIHGESSGLDLQETCVPNLACSRVVDGRFKVMQIGGFLCHDAEFFWEVKAVRKDVPDLTVEPRKSEVEVLGQGPYKYYNLTKGKA